MGDKPVTQRGSLKLNTTKKQKHHYPSEGLGTPRAKFTLFDRIQIMRCKSGALLLLVVGLYVTGHNIFSL
jgi:hypothetical protein